MGRTHSRPLLPRNAGFWDMRTTVRHSAIPFREFPRMVRQTKLDASTTSSLVCGIPRSAPSTMLYDTARS